MTNNPTPFYAIANRDNKLLTSHKDNPNENYARELMEYFTLGRGNYSFQDVKEASRAFTGLRFNHHKYPYVQKPMIMLFLYAHLPMDYLANYLVD